MNLLQRSSTVKSSMYAYMHSHKHMDIHPPTHTHTYIYIYILSHIQSHSHIHTITYILAHNHIHTCTHRLTHIYTNTHTDAHTHIHTLTDAHPSHTHTFYSIPLFVYGCYVCGQRSGLCSQLWILRRLCLLFLLLHGLLSQQRRVKVGLDLGMQQPLCSTMQLSTHTKGRLTDRYATASLLSNRAQQQTGTQMDR